MNNVKVQMVLKSGKVFSWEMPLDEATTMLESIANCKPVFYAVNHGSVPCWMVRVDEMPFSVWGNLDNPKSGSRLAAMNTPETDVIGGPYIEREDGVEQPIMAFKEFEDIYFASRYSKWLWSLSTNELERRKEIVKQQLDNNNSGSIITA